MIPVGLNTRTRKRTRNATAFSAALLGSITSNSGSMIGGFALGLLECFAAGYGNSTWQNAVAFLVLFLVLVFKPTGIMGKKEIRKV